MWIARTVEQLKIHRRGCTDPVALVPTMGALHQGHAALIREARQHAETVIVSLFVNPTQFNNPHDLARYPRPFEEDCQRCRGWHVDGVFAPATEEMYPPGQLDVQVTVPALADILEGAARPGHFAGVCRVVLKLLNLVQPRIACFGDKDYQQLQVVKAMVADLCLPVRIHACPTVRDADGLALSSRNVLLDDLGRRHALGLSKALNEAHHLVVIEKETDPAVVTDAMRQVLCAHHVEVDYAQLCHPTTLAVLNTINLDLTGAAVALVAGYVQNVRLIDNKRLTPPGSTPESTPESTPGSIPGSAPENAPCPPEENGVRDH